MYANKAWQINIIARLFRYLKRYAVETVDASGSPY